MKITDLDEYILPEKLSKIPAKKPVIMLNLLKFKELADYQNECVNNRPSDGITAYYQRYFKYAKMKIQEAGASIIYSGTVCTELIGYDVAYWDSINLIEYPSIDNFLNMVSTVEYQQLRIHRTASLEDSRLIVTIKGEEDGY